MAFQSFIEGNKAALRRLEQTSREKKNVSLSHKTTGINLETKKKPLAIHKSYCQTVKRVFTKFRKRLSQL